MKYLIVILFAALTACGQVNHTESGQPASKSVSLTNGGQSVPEVGEDPTGYECVQVGQVQKQVADGYRGVTYWLDFDTWACSKGTISCFVYKSVLTQDRLVNSFDGKHMEWSCPVRPSNEIFRAV